MKRQGPRRTTPLTKAHGTARVGHISNIAQMRNLLCTPQLCVGAEVSAHSTTLGEVKREEAFTMAPAPQSWFQRSMTRLRALSSTSLPNLLAHPVSRRRALLVVAALLVCLYALSVFGYVLSIPEIGLRCVFTPVIARVYPGFVRLP